MQFACHVTKLELKILQYTVINFGISDNLKIILQIKFFQLLFLVIFILYCPTFRPLKWAFKGLGITIRFIDNRQNLGPYQIIFFNLSKVRLSITIFKKKMTLKFPKIYLEKIELLKKFKTSFNVFN